MKLNEIIDTDIQVKRGLGPHQSHIGQEIGNGSFAYVYTHTKDPHMVVKGSALSVELDEDPYFQYVYTIVEHNLAAENPYFPRIYGITIHDPSHRPEQRKGTSVLYDIDMEKLIRIDADEIENEEYRACLNKMFGEDERFKNDKYQQEIKRPSVTDLAYASDIMMEYIGNFSIHGIKITDPKLREALDIIKGIGESRPEFEYDIRRPNMMFRRTSVGLQLVLTDPLYNDNAEAVT